MALVLDHIITIGKPGGAVIQVVVVYSMDTVQLYIILHVTNNSD